MSSGHICRQTCMCWLSLNTETRENGLFLTRNYSDNLQKTANPASLEETRPQMRLSGYLWTIFAPKNVSVHIHSFFNMYLAFFLVSSMLLTEWKSVFKIDSSVTQTRLWVERLLKLRGAKLRTTTSSHIITCSLSLTSPPSAFSARNSVLCECELLLLLVGQQLTLFLSWSELLTKS